MATNYLEIESTSGLSQSVKQALRFKTGNFIWRVRFNTALDPQTVKSICHFLLGAAAQNEHSLRCTAK